MKLSIASEMYPHLVTCTVIALFACTEMYPHLFLNLLRQNCKIRIAKDKVHEIDLPKICLKTWFLRDTKICIHNQVLKKSPPIVLLIKLPLTLFVKFVN